MSLFSWLKPKESRDARNNHTFSDEDREYSKEIRAKKREIELMKLEKEYELHNLRLQREQLRLQQEIDELKGEDDDIEYDGEDNAESVLIKAITPLIANAVLKGRTPGTESATNVTANASPSVSPPSPSRVYSDEKLQEMWDKSPPLAKKYAASHTDEQILPQIRGLLPGSTDQDVLAALKVIRA